LLFSTPLLAQFPQVTYEVQEGSTITDECLVCGRPGILRSQIAGTFVLERLPVRIVGELYEISALDLSCVGCGDGVRYSISGGGRHHRPDTETQTTSLELTVNEATGVALQSGTVDTLAPWPMIDVTVTEDGTRDPVHKLTLRLLASPKVELTPYELVKGSLEDGSGSMLEVICPPCELVEPRVALEGTLLVGQVEAVEDGFSTYRLDQIHLNDLLPPKDYKILGSGSYQEGGDIEILKQMRLALAINDLNLRELRGGPVPVQKGGAFPVLDVEVEETRTNTLWYRLHLVARPASAPAFRRGDTNSDGRVDIADPVYHLLWQFTGGPAPGCREAADSDADGVHNLTDAIFTLQHLFLDGPAPPAPGPEQCGLAPEAKFGCESYPVCGLGG
jgi:hypothetical protein